MSFQYRPDIDGLRAIAVLAVVFFHAEIPGFSGGFVGVDVFFVISGFLITSIILKEIRAGKFSIARFYERRIRRIFPALFPVIAFVLTVGAIIFYSKSFKDLGGSITATTLFVSNIFFWRHSDYFAAAAITKPLLHTWSLAVEEQFYIFFPLLLIAINRYSKKHYLPWFLGIWFLSFIISMYSVYSYPIPTFYLVPTRAWELLTGSILALGIIPKIQTNYLRNILSLLGLGLIFYSIGFFTEDTIFPGANALFPVLGTSLIVYSGIGGIGEICKYLSIKPLVFIGLISYSLYLWHWPLFVFAKYLLFRDLNTAEVTGIILIAFLVSVLSFKFIEQPFRGIQPIIPTRKHLFAVAGMMMLVTSSVGLIVDYQNGMPYRFPKAEAATAQALLDMKTDPQWIDYEENMKNISKLNEGKIPAVIGAEGAVPSFVLWGDSHAKSLVTAVAVSAKRYGLSGYDIAHGEVIRPLIGINKEGSSYDSKHNQSVINFIKSHPEIKTVILAGFWTNDIRFRDAIGEYSGKQPSSVLLKAGLARSVDALQALGCNIVLVSEIPILKDHPDRVLYLAKRFNEKPDFRKISPTVSEHEKRNRDVMPILEEFEKRPNITLIHPESILFDKNKRLIVMADNKMIYIDDDHLTTYGSHLVSPIFNEVFKKIKIDL